MALLRLHSRNGAIMRPTEFSTDTIIKLLRKQQIATLPQLMAAVGTQARRTVFRKLAQLSYRSSYSHRGAYYTVDERRILMTGDCGRVGRCGSPFAALCGQRRPRWWRSERRVISSGSWTI